MSPPRSNSLAIASASTPSVESSEQHSGFALVDEIVAAASEHGVLTVRTAEGMVAPLARHIQRRAELAGRPTISSGISPVADPWRELARSLSVTESTDPAAVARSIVRTAATAVVVVAQMRETAWGRLVLDHVAELCLDPELHVLLVLLSDREAPPRVTRPFRPAATGLQEARVEGTPCQLIVDVETLSAADGRRWWTAVVERDELLSQAPLDRLESLDAWWETIRSQPPAAVPTSPGLSADGQRLMALTMRAQGALSSGQADALVTSAARRELVAKGVLLADRAGGLSPRPGLPSVEARLEPAEDRRLAALLVDPAHAGPEPDPWITMRAAELYAFVGDDTEAERLAFAALSAMPQASARDDLWRRWQGALEDLQAAQGEAETETETAGDSEIGTRDHLALIVRSAEHALALSDGDRADELARQAVSIDAERFDVLLLRGRSSATRGDLTTASLALLRALARAQGDPERAKAASIMAEVRYLAGDHAEAERHAADAVERTDALATRLHARNVLGKLMLGRGQFEEAERHFAQDAYDAAQAGEVEDELRARLNRAIAALQQGRRDEARRMFREVQIDGEAHRSMRAVAYALANLATIAIIDRSFEDALDLSERAIEVRHRLGERIGLVRPITNLAELRLQLGLVDEAEQALRFGLNACGPDLPASRYAFFALVAARIHLARGNSGQAAQQLSVARSGASCSGDGGIVGECERLAARIALEDGDLGRAEAALGAAVEHTPRASEHGELALLSARFARACGEPYAEAARRALQLAERADEPEVAREAYVLLVHAARAEEDAPSASRYLNAALAERDRISECLPESMRQRLLARRDLGELRQLEDEYGADGADVGALRQSTLSTPSTPTASAGREHRSQARRLVGESAPMRSLRSTIARVARTQATVLVNGETGTGKELVAEAIHRGSRRSRGPLVKVNCAALVETLLLSELFGHEKGAFTGASSRRRGRFELAEGGTLFLDEIGDISARTQVALLRVLQDGTFERVGGTTTQHANVRIVCATHRNLREMVEAGTFREDLYYRLCGVALEVPPLRDRLSDLPALATALLRDNERTSGVLPKPLSRHAVDALSRYRWPGNVRELDNALRVAALFAAGAEIQLPDLTDNVDSLRQLTATSPAGGAQSSGTVPPSPSLGDGSSAPSSAGQGPQTLPSGQAPVDGSGHSGDLVYAEVRQGTSLADMKRKLEQECIARALVESGGNITRAAALLGMKRPRLSQLVKQYQLGTVVEERKP